MHLLCLLFPFFLGMERVAFGTVALSDVAMGLVILIGALLAGAGGGAAMGALMGIVPGLAGLTAPGSFRRICLFRSIGRCVSAFWTPWCYRRLCGR